jgi:hypothetical protein
MIQQHLHFQTKSNFQFHLILRINKITKLFTSYEINKTTLKTKKSNDPLINIYKNSKRKIEGNEFHVFVFFLIESYYRNLFSEQFDSISLGKVFDVESRAIEYFTSTSNDFAVDEENALNFGTFQYFQDRIISIHALIENNFNSERSNGFLVHSQSTVMNGSLQLELFSPKEWRNLQMKEINERILNDMSKVDFHFKLHLKYKKNVDFLEIDNLLRKLISRIHYQSPDQKNSNEDLIPIQIKEIKELHYNFMDRFGMVNIWDVLVMPSEYDSIYLKDAGFKVSFKWI